MRREDMLLELADVSKQFGGLRAVSNVSLAVPGGSLVSIIGPNGAGKSTLFNLITGFYKVNRGRIFFKGEDITNKKPHEICQRGLVRTFQTTQLFLEETVLNNIKIANHSQIKSGLWFSTIRGRAYRQQKDAQKDKVAAILATVGLASQAYDLAGSLPPEGRQRLAIGMALACGPEMLLLDEPFGGLTEDEGEKLSELLMDLNAKGLTICLVEHKMRIVMRLSSRIFVLNYGEKIAEGTPEEIQNDPKVVEAYLGRRTSA